jgi:hypothetical protein
VARAECRVSGCTWTAAHPVKDVVGYLSTWHVYEDHPDVWRSVAGNRPPIDPDPRTPEGLLYIMLEQG